MVERVYLSVDGLIASWLVVSWLAGLSGGLLAADVVTYRLLGRLAT